MCYWYHRTWAPGMHEPSGNIDPNKVVKWSRRWILLKKITCWLIVFSVLMMVLFFLIRPLVSSSDEEQREAFEDEQGQLIPGAHPANPALMMQQEPFEPNNSSNPCSTSNGIQRSRGTCSCKPGYFNCGPQDNCVPFSTLCDGKKHCNNGRDEAHCVTISNALVHLDVKKDNKDVEEGFVLVGFQGTWHPYCSKEWSTDMGSRICAHLFKMGTLGSIESFHIHSLAHHYPEGNKSQLHVALNEPNKNGSILHLANFEDDSSSDWWKCKIGFIKCIPNP